MSNTLRVLIVEDSERDAELLLLALRRGGYETSHETIQTAEAMRTALAAQPWDVVLADYSLPTFDGMSALDILRQSGRDIPFILVSGEVDEKTAAAMERTGADAVLSKNRLRELVPAIERALKGRKQQQPAVPSAQPSSTLSPRKAHPSAYVVAVVGAVLMVFLKTAIPHLHSDPFALLIIPVALAGWLGGLLLGLIAVCVGGLASVTLSLEGDVGAEGFLAFLGFLAEGVIVSVALEAFHRMRSRLEASLASLREQRSIVTSSEERLRLAHSELQALSRQVISTEHGARKHAESALHDVEDQLRQAQKMEAIGRLAGGVAHDFNNVLSVILCNAEIVLDDLNANDPMRSDIEEIKKAGKRAAGLTRQLLLFSRQQVLESKVIDLNETLCSMDKMLQRILGEDVELVSLPAAALGRVRADPSHIEQVILNLVVNARDAMPTGGRLTIETVNITLDCDYEQNHLPAKAGAYVMLAVTDTGCGMDKATQARIFEPFFTTKDKAKGTGLGLSTVFGIVQQSGGNIWVYSEPGKGTTFKVYLPRVDADVDVLRAPPAPATLRGTETVLVVEDEEQVRSIVVGVLRRQGYNVIPTQHAGEALLICERHPDAIHLLLTDVVMPQMSGPELAKRLAVTRPGMKVLCMSGYTDDSIVRHGVLERDFAFVQKPITPASLATKVREVLDGGQVTTGT